MKFLLDEDVPIEIAHALRVAGLEAKSVEQEIGKRTTDAVVWQKATELQWVVVTCNRGDFLELAGTEPQTGLIVLNRRRTRVAECNHLLALIRRAGENGLARNINFA